ncbi:MAG: 50S ribosomal protein L24 [Candidatus Omnitrophica bacterium]|nr:50S ribosomal protein L24 [Candidatus Omnitrophota bacterium]MBU0895087.1 50S ribosomal protein L24 [Candidatus Omnitrophota bacterium]MBU1808288.1 50S ribosomal protein L24 [Candidatus Omnitrophota bacterium]
MNKIKKNDVVYVLAGRDKGKTGKVFRMMPSKDKALVEGINYVKKHMRKTKADQQGGIVQMESAIHVSNIALFCKTCNKPSHVGINILADGTRSRFCKRCKEVI